MGLTAKNQRFVAEFLIDGNATQAAIRAGYSKASAHAQGHRLLKNAEISAAINEGRQAALQAAGAEAIRIIRQLVSIGYSDLGELLDDSGAMRPLDKIPESLRLAISSVEIEEGLPVKVLTDDGVPRELVPRTVKVKLWDKVKALELLGKSIAMFTDKVDVKAELSLETLVEQAAARRKASQ